MRVDPGPVLIEWISYVEWNPGNCATSGPHWHESSQHVPTSSTRKQHGVSFEETSDIYGEGLNGIKSMHFLKTIVELKFDRMEISYSNEG